MNEKHAANARKWMSQNPRAYELFDRFASQMAAVGRRFGARLIAERIRWECRLQKIGEFKWNDHYTKYVALEWVKHNPRYADLLEFRNGGSAHDEDDGPEFLLFSGKGV